MGLPDSPEPAWAEIDAIIGPVGHERAETA